MSMNSTLGAGLAATDGVLPFLPLSAGEDINVGFTLLSGYMVFFMQAGFAMLSAGSVRAKNAKNIILLNLLDACFGCFAWYATGYAFAFGDPHPNADGTYPWINPFIGHKYFFQIDLPRSALVKWFFQFTFAATSATIVSGALAERCKFESYICYNLILVAFVYPVVAHWVWSPFGWMSALRTSETATSGYILLFGTGVYDFAGDGPVHMVGGFASLAGAWVLGARIGRFDAEGTPVDMPGHNASLTLLGVFLLWFGWFGFNPGSTNAILMPTLSPERFVSGYSDVSAAIAVNTTVSAAAATIATLLVAMMHTYFTLRVVVWDLIVAGNGALAGLVAITGPCAFVETWAAWVIGLCAGAFYYAASKIILFKLRIDDPLDAIAVHAVSGMWGMIGGALFASSNLVTKWFGPLPGYPIVNPINGSGQRPYGLFMGGGGALLAAHVIYILVIAAWTCGLMTPFFIILHKLGIMRVPPEVEAAGLDISYHGGGSYPGHQEGGAGVVLGARSGLDGKSSEELQLMVDRAVDRALERQRGWVAPPSSGGYSLDGVARRGGTHVHAIIEEGEEEGEEEEDGQEGVQKSTSLANLQAAMQQKFNNGDDAGKDD